ncbi:MAG: M50 family metallopeptidase [Myxococcota bacterium]|jgi:hypothetical protein|nr:M50 family metallopeptidase [Myxococcota bacterium]
MTEKELKPLQQQARWAFGGVVALTLALFFVPYGQYVIYPVMLFSTYAHEMGHGIAAILMGGSFLDFQMWADGSGVARHAGNYGDFARGVVAAGGLLGPAILAAVFFLLSRRAFWSRLALYGFAAASVVAVLLFVRNGFGVGFVLLVALVCAAVARLGGERIAQFFLLFLAVQLSLTVFSRGDYLFVEYANTAAGPMPSDVGQMSQALGGPYWLWGGLVGLMSVAILVGGALLFFRSEAAGAAKAA